MFVIFSENTSIVVKIKYDAVLRKVKTVLGISKLARVIAIDDVRIMSGLVSVEEMTF